MVLVVPNVGKLFPRAVLGLDVRVSWFLEDLPNPIFKFNFELSHLEANRIVLYELVDIQNFVPKFILYIPLNNDTGIGLALLITGGIKNAKILFRNESEI